MGLNRKFPDLWQCFNKQLRQIRATPMLIEPPKYFANKIKQKKKTKGKRKVKKK